MKMTWFMPPERVRRLLSWAEADAAFAAFLDGIFVAPGSAEPALTTMLEHPPNRTFAALLLATTDFGRGLTPFAPELVPLLVADLREVAVRISVDLDAQTRMAKADRVPDLLATIDGVDLRPVLRDILARG